jgi:hypothetical protein
VQAPGDLFVVGAIHAEIVSQEAHAHAADSGKSVCFGRRVAGCAEAHFVDHGWVLTRHRDGRD